MNERFHNDLKHFAWWLSFLFVSLIVFALIALSVKSGAAVFLAGAAFCLSALLYLIIVLLIELLR